MSHRQKRSIVRGAQGQIQIEHNALPRGSGRPRAPTVAGRKAAQRLAIALGKLAHGILAGRGQADRTRTLRTAPLGGSDKHAPGLAGFSTRCGQRSAEWLRWLAQWVGSKLGAEALRLVS
jgi:hypothetical protein